jgi:hypothetical protein
MRRILVSCALLMLLALPAAAAAGAPAQAKPGFLVVRRAASDGGVNGRPVATLVVKGFVLGRISQEARVDIYQQASAPGPQVKGADVSTRPTTWHHFIGKEYRGSNFRFRAIGGFYRVVVRGAGVYLFAGGQGHVTLRGSTRYPTKDGTFSVNGGTFRSMPTNPVARKLGGG